MAWRVADAACAFDSLSSSTAYRVHGPTEPPEPAVPRGASDDSEAEGDDVAQCESPPCSLGTSNADPDSDSDSNAETDAGKGGDGNGADYHIAYDDGQRHMERLATELPYRWLSDAPATLPRAETPAG